MKIGLYSEFYAGNTLGGRELIASVLAQVLGRQHAVEYVHHAPDLRREDFVHRFGGEADRLTLRYAEYAAMPAAKLPWRRHREERNWLADLSRSYDLFVNITHHLPVFCHASVGFLMVLFPFYDPHALWDHASTSLHSRLGGGLRRAFHQWQWRRRLGSYQVHTAISEYSRHWSQLRWGVNCQIIYPPADAPPAPADKTPLILSVGRFSVKGVYKRQEVMMRAFVEMTAGASEPTRGWQYVSTGGVNPSTDEQAFFRRVQELAHGANARAEASVPRAELCALYAQAAIFWHAAGYDQDTAQDPGLAEHYGIATVEAMLAGCVPVVIRKGAQPELIEHGVSGFLWDTPAQLQAYTQALIDDPALRARMGAAARTRALANFTEQSFVRRFVALAQPHVREPLLEPGAFSVCS